MTIEELETKLTELDDLRSELNKQIAELKARDEKNPKPPHPRREPDLGKIYFFLGREGDIRSFHWDGVSVDKHIYNSANVFMSEAEARFALERRKVLAEMREWAGNWDDGVALKYDGTNKLISAIFIAPRQYTFGEMRFATKEDAENCIKAVGQQHLKKYYFGISEDEDEIQT